MEVGGDAEGFGGVDGPEVDPLGNAFDAGASGVSGGAGLTLAEVVDGLLDEAGVGGFAEQSDAVVDEVGDFVGDDSDVVGAADGDEAGAGVVAAADTAAAPDDTDGAVEALGEAGAKLAVVKRLAVRQEVDGEGAAVGVVVGGVAGGVQLTGGGFDGRSGTAVGGVKPRSDPV